MASLKAADCAADQRDELAPSQLTDLRPIPTEARPPWQNTGPSQRGLLPASRLQCTSAGYNSPAELYLSRRRGRHTDYRRFATAAEAIHYAVLELRTRRSLSAWMQVGDERFNEDEINRLYDDGDYPLRTPLND